MRVMVERCCGLDVHQEAVVACLLIGAPGVRPTKEVRTFRTMTRELEALRDWLTAARVTHVGMESTGVSVKSVELPCRRDCGVRRGSSTLSISSTLGVSRHQWRQPSLPRARAARPMWRGLLGRSPTHRNLLDCTKKAGTRPKQLSALESTPRLRR